MANAVGAFVAMAYTFIVTYIIGITINRFIDLRVTEDEKYVGLDIFQY
jgi:ammonia channel protein AmtB